MARRAWRKHRRPCQHRTSQWDASPTVIKHRLRDQQLPLASVAVDTGRRQKTSPLADVNRSVSRDVINKPVSRFAFATYQPTAADRLEPVRPSPRPRRTFQKAVRFRYISGNERDIVGSAISSNVTPRTIDAGADEQLPTRTDRLRHRARRTPEQQMRRQERERGPWQCPLCDRPPLSSILGLRGHVALQHRQYCTWTGKVVPFVDDEQERHQLNTVRRGRGRHAGHARLGSKSAAQPVDKAPQPVVATRTSVAAHGAQAADVRGGQCRMLTRHSPNPNIDAVGLPGNGRTERTTAADVATWMGDLIEAYVLQFVPSPDAPLVFPAPSSVEDQVPRRSA